MSTIDILKGPIHIDPEEVTQRVVRYLEGTKVRRGIIFGSFARGEADLGSDLDLALVEETEKPFVERGLEHLPLFHLCIDLAIGLDLLVYTPEEFERLLQSGNSLISRIEQEGRTIYVRSDE